MVSITGFVQNLIGGYFSDFVLVAKALQPFFSASGNTLFPIGGINFNSVSGFLSASLPETQSSGQLIAFIGNYTANGIFREIQFTPVIIPNVSSIDISQLLIPIPS